MVIATVLVFIIVLVWYTRSTIPCSALVAVPFGFAMYVDAFFYNYPMNVYTRDMYADDTRQIAPLYTGGGYANRDIDDRDDNASGGDSDMDDTDGNIDTDDNASDVDNDVESADGGIDDANDLYDLYGVELSSYTVGGRSRKTHANHHAVQGGGLPLIKHRLTKVAMEKLSPFEKKLIYDRAKPKLTHCTIDQHAKYFSRILTPEMGTNTYEVKHSVPFSYSCHWGQLKLMLAEVEFLTQVLMLYTKMRETRPIYFVYAGAAPGHHAARLHSMFPMMRFVFYDPNTFFESVNTISRIEINQEFFLDTSALKWSTAANPDKFIVFCSDIRSFPATEENIMDNMRMQERWVKIMNPYLSSLKFRLPWNNETTEYLKGDVYIGVYPWPSSTETRLVVPWNEKGYEVEGRNQTYDNGLYDRQLAYHNKVNRNLNHSTFVKYDYETLGIHHLDKCYDCAAFVYIIREYVDAITNIESHSFPEVKKSVAQKGWYKILRDIEEQIVPGKNIVNQTRRSHNKRIKRMRMANLQKCGDTACVYCGELKKDDAFNEARNHDHLKLKSSSTEAFVDYSRFL